MLSVIEWNVRPQIFDAGFIELRWYSLLFLGGFVVGYLILNKIFKKEGLPVELLDKLTFYVVIATIIGARVGHCIFYEPQIYLKNPLRIILPFEGTPGVDFRFTGFQGLASHGGALGLLLGLYLYAKKYNRPYLWILDRIAIVTPLAGAMIRVGNFFNSEIVGLPSTLPWSVKFFRMYPPDTPAEFMQALHPAQLYEAICYLLIFAFLIRYYYKNYPDFKPGTLIGLFFILVFTARFLIEFVKENQENFEEGLLLNMGQLLSIPFVLIGLYLVFRKAPQKSSAA